jgi:hypothetical protein
MYKREEMYKELCWKYTKNSVGSQRPKAKIPNTGNTVGAKAKVTVRKETSKKYEDLRAKV